MCFSGLAFTHGSLKPQGVNTQVRIILRAETQLRYPVKFRQNENCWNHLKLLSKVGQFLSIVTTLPVDLSTL